MFSLPVIYTKRLHSRDTSRTILKILSCILCACVVASALVGTGVVHAQFLSDATGFVNRLDIVTGTGTHEVLVTSNFDVTDYTFDAADKRLILTTGPMLSSSIAEILIPVELLSGDLKLYVDQMLQHNVTARTTDSVSFLVLQLDNHTKGSAHTIEITGTESSLSTFDSTRQPDSGPAYSFSDVMDDLNSSSGTAGGNDGAANDHGGGCLVATAVFGSELHYDVQHLREMRDHKVASTQLGRTFLSVFNSAYYTFSPHVADHIREDPAFKQLVSLLLVPMLLSLNILNDIQEGSEKDLLVYGTVIIVMNLVIYIASPTVAVSKTASFAACRARRMWAMS